MPQLLPPVRSGWSARLQAQAHADAQSAGHHAADGAAAAQHPPHSSHPAAAVPAPSPTDWVQAYDASTGYFYYYCEALQETKWEPPEHFIPLDIRGWPAFEGTHTRFDEEGNAVASVDAKAGAGGAASPSGPAEEGQPASAPGGAGAAGAAAATAAAHGRAGDSGGGENHSGTKGSTRGSEAESSEGAADGGPWETIAPAHRGKHHAAAEVASASGRAELVRADGGAFSAMSPAEVAEALAAGCDADMHKYWCG